MPKPDTRTFVEPAASRAIQEWTPAMIKAARSSADGGNLQLAADFCEAAMRDDRVSAALQTRTNGLVSLPLTFEAARGTKRLVKALEAGEDWWAAYPATALAQLLRWGIVLGVGLAQQVWVERGATINRIVPKLRVWSPRHLRFDWTRRTWRLRVDNGTEIDITPGDGTWILFLPYGDNRPWVHGAWNAISNWHLLKTYAIEDWGYYSSKNAGGHLVGVQKEDGKTSSKEKRKELADDLFAAQANSAIVPPPGFDIKIVESVANTWETFEKQKNAADLGMSVAILGQNLSTEVTGPVSTGATLHGRVLQTFIDFDAESLTTCIHDQSLVWWAEFNFGRADDAPWPVYDTKPPEDRKAQADVGKTKAETAKILASTGIATVNEVRIAAGLEPLKEGEGGDELVKPAPAVAATNDVPPTPPPSKKKGAPPPIIKLRSGRFVRADSGITQGQLYVDAVADHARARAAGILDADIEDVLAAVDGAESYEDLRKALAKTFKGMSPDKLAELTEKALVMAHLGGRHAQNEDA